MRMGLGRVNPIWRIECSALQSGSNFSQSWAEFWWHISEQIRRIVKTVRVHLEVGVYAHFFVRRGQGNA